MTNPIRPGTRPPPLGAHSTLKWLGLGLLARKGEEQNERRMGVLITVTDDTDGTNLHITGLDLIPSKGYAFLGSDTHPVPPDEIPVAKAAAKQWFFNQMGMADQMNMVAVGEDPVILMEDLPAGADNNQVHFAIENHPTMREDLKQVLLVALGFHESAGEQMTLQTLMGEAQSVAQPLAKAVDSLEAPAEDFTRIEAAVKEQGLIDKFGKRNLEKLAKQIGYQGALINKPKKKRHGKTHSE